MLLQNVRISTPDILKMKYQAKTQCFATGVWKVVKNYYVMLKYYVQFCASTVQAYMLNYV
jgi:hypothetical protein